MHLRKPRDLTPGKSKGVQKGFTQAPGPMGGGSSFGRKQLFTAMEDAQVEMGDELSVAPAPTPRGAVDTSPGGSDAPS